MRIFEQRQIREAKDHAVSGGQALHLMSGRFAYLRSDTPLCFKGRGQIAHLFDQDRQRLEATARKLGVRKVLVERVGAPGQHVDLCGKPLERALALAAEDSAEQLAVFTNVRLAIPWEVVPDIVSQHVDAHERGMVVIGGPNMGKTYALKILTAKPVKDANA